MAFLQPKSRQVAPARHPCGTRRALRTVAPSRAWRGWQGFVAQDPAFIAPYQDLHYRKAPYAGFDPAIADCRLQGTANSPSSVVRGMPWRRGWDSNPRDRLNTCLPALQAGAFVQLSHLSTIIFLVPTIIINSGYEFYKELWFLNFSGKIDLCECLGH